MALGTPTTTIQLGTLAVAVSLVSFSYAELEMNVWLTDDKTGLQLSFPSSISTSLIEVPSTEASCSLRLVCGLLCIRRPVALDNSTMPPKVR
jgi:hypothetical protein